MVRVYVFLAAMLNRVGAHKFQLVGDTDGTAAYRNRFDM